MLGNSGEAKHAAEAPKLETAVVVRPARITGLTSEDLAEALGLHPWNFQVEVPDGTPSLQIAVRLTENGAERELSRMTLNAEEWDGAAGKRIKGSKQFRVLLTVSPVDNTTVKPLLESAKLRIFAKEFQSGSGSVAIIDNPFTKKPARGVSIFSSGQRGTAKAPRTNYDLLSTDDYQTVLKISFFSGLPLKAP